MHDGAPPHIGFCVQKVLHSFYRRTENWLRNILQMATDPDLTSCDYWLWSHLKSVVNRGNAGNLATLRDRIILKVRQIKVELLRFAVKHAVRRMHFFGTLERSAH
ncbi:hypothetical protein AVEN_22898-1 [Araneus ventricosus]|uniref:Uncharacterized protein n=1 Tax=Araneus ventricosus TaxID=182803 RepID=A0A4Y2D6K4_ARAVE|nr:hypothetical protein AVEN_22898-1 [Araneus ventricosus]